ncbi:GAP family protein [Mycolicibacterium sp. PDY-3]|uniref:GAP family protein n=1 Tax=Mycolicibacterium sp. PDY-3 TaxID=3376069 RepID=UPI00378CF76B
MRSTSPIWSPKPHRRGDARGSWPGSASSSRASHPVFAASIGAATAMPSIDYFALLAIIIASRTPPLEQGLALLTFLLLAGWAATVPMLSFIVAPEKTRTWVQQMNAWVRSRTRKQAGIFVAVVGVILIGLGITGL